MKQRNVRKAPERQKTNVFSYYAGNRLADRAELQSRPNQSSRFGLFLRILAVVCIVAALLFAISVSASSIIRTAQNERPTHDAAVYRETANSLIKGSLFNRTKLTFDYQGFIEDMKTAYPEIESVGITFDIFGRQPVIRLSFYEPSLVVTSKGVNWVVDSRGVAVSKAEGSAVDNTKELPRITDNIGLISKAGDRLLSSEEITYLTTMTGLLKVKGIVVESTTLPLVPHELDVKIVGDPYFVKMNLDEPVAEQVGTLIAARETLSAKGQIPTEYLDIRAGEKTYWR